MAKAQQKTLQSWLSDFRGNAAGRGEYAGMQAQTGLDDLNRKISGMQSPASYQQASDNFNYGLDQYGEDARLAGVTAGSLLDQATGMKENAGYSSGEKQGIRAATAAGFAAPYSAAANQMKMNALRTGNSAGMNANVAGMARERGRMISAGLGGLEEGFGNKRIEGEQNAAQLQQGAMGLKNQALSLSQFPQQARLQRMQGEQQLMQLSMQPIEQQRLMYQSDLGAQESALGVQEQEAARPGFWGKLGSGVAQGVGQAIGGIGGKIKF